MTAALTEQPETTVRGDADALSFRIGGVTVNLAGADPVRNAPRLRAGVSAETEFFLVRGGQPDCEVRAAWATLDGAAPGQRIFDSGSLWKLYRSGTDSVFQFHSPAYGPLPYKQARFNADFSAGEVLMQAGYFDPARTALPLEYPLDELLVMHLLSLGRGVEIHGCGVQDRDGRGYLFVGQSGAGKSTTARLWTRDPQVTVLSDDRIILRREAGRIWMYGTPWHGEAELACSLRTPLSRIYFLTRGADNRTVRLTQAETVSRLLACSFIPFYSPEGLAFTLEMLQQVTAAVPGEEYRFVPDERAVEFVRELAA